MPKLKIIVTSTREGRKGRGVADWFLDKARAHGKWEVELVDLKDVALPPMDEPNHPTQRKYTKEHTKAWSALVAEADAFVWVTPEYNHGMPPAMLNAIDYLFVEWNYKPAGFVSYGGVSAGTRSVQMSRLVLPGVKMVPIPESVALPFFSQHFDANGRFEPGPGLDPSVNGMLDELWKWNTALATIRG